MNDEYFDDEWDGIVYELAPQSPDRGVKNTGRGEAKRNPCKKEPPTKQSSEGTTEILSPLSGLAITIRINMMPISIIILYELRIMNYEL